MHESTPRDGDAGNGQTISSALDRETRTAIDTATAAFLLNRKPGTLHKWSNLGRGPIQPVRVNGRLAWPVADIRRLLEVS